MKHNDYGLRALLVLCLLLTGLASRADNFLQNADNYTCMQMGMDKIQFKLPTQYDGAFNEGVSDGRVYVTVDGGSRQSLFNWWCSKYRELDEPKVIHAYQGGTFYLTGKCKSVSKNNFTKNDGDITYLIDGDSSNKDHYTTTVEWTVPREWRGHKLKLEMWCKNEYRDWTWYIPDGVKTPTSFHTLGIIDMPEAGEASVTLNEPMLSVTRDHVNEVMISYSFVVNKIFWAKLHYTDAVTGEQKVQSLSTSAKVGFAYIPADRPWNDIYIEAQVTDAQTKETDERYRIIVESEKQTSSMLHHPKGFKATITPEGHAMLTWTVTDPGQADISDGDFFEIQRNTTGSVDVNDPNWRTINMENDFMLDTLLYTFTDKTLMNQYEGKAVAYRIRRSVTAMWQWSSPATYQQYQIPWLLTLPMLTSASVQRTDTWNDEQHIVQFAYQKGNNDYDSNGNFLVRDASDFERLDQLVKDKKATYQKAIFYLSNADDWKRCATLVSNGDKNLQIVLAGDIDLSDCQVMIGNQSRYFTGTVDGNGHTIFLGYNATSDHVAPFGSVGNATFRNLRIEGYLRTTKKFVGGLIAEVQNSGTVNIDKVSVGTTLYLDGDGDASSGGIIGIMNNGTKAYITNSCFSGEFVGTTSHSNGGFVGVAMVDTKLEMNNCLFAPTRITTLPEGCNTFARMDKNSEHTFTNCYYTRVYGSGHVDGKECVAIFNTNDWLYFRQRVQDAKGGVVNAVLCSDIHVGTSAGYLEGSPFTGTFEGNGHTLDVEINGDSYYYIAPFVLAKNATIRNLRVTGTIKGGIHSSGLIGSGSNSNNILENVRVSASITTTSTHAGGFIGHGGSGNNTITNCLFDGSITAYGGSYVGAIMGWEDGGTNNQVSNCLERGSYTGFAHAGMNYNNRNNGSVWGGTNCYSYHDWGEVGKASSLSYSELAKKLGSGWTVTDNEVVPVMAEKDVTESFGGTSAATMTGEALAKALGESNWQAGNNNAYLIMRSDGNLCNYAVWDPRAKLQLRINMQGENGTVTTVVDLTGNEEAINNQRFTHDLTRKCVEYSFDLVLRQGTSPMTIAGTDADSLAIPVTKIDKGDMASYRFMNMNRITSVETKTKQSSVQLTWQTSGGESDYFRVLRRNHTTDDNAAWTDTLATEISQQFYEDKTVLVQQTYDYRVESVFLCEGTHIDAMTRTGACEPTGMVSGYVRMADGTAMAGVLVECRPKGTIPGADALYTYTTDETGYFVFSKLPYQIDSKGNSNGTYTITVPTKGGSASYTAPNEGGIVNFTQGSNWTQNFNFYMDTYYVYSGNVYYRNTTIPVPGVSFKLDGKVMHDGSQRKIETDTQGGFSLSIPAGAHHVQAVKDGHYFANQGFLINRDAPEDPTLYNFTENVSSAVIWDSTTVVLRGRVVGGDVQGNLPLGQGLSVNNLGDSLKIVLQLEGDNTSYLIRYQDDETVRSSSFDVMFGPEGKNTTHVDITRHTMTIRPDAATGEYELELHPAKYKVVEVSAQGYPTLFQQGKVGETIDLAFNVQGDVCEYNRIYHAVPTVEVTQFNATGEKFFGVKQLTASDNIGNSAKVTLWYLDKDSVEHYSFGHPVFMAGSPYGFMLQACEKYYWNNNFSKRVDIVNLDQRGKISIKNALTTDSKTADWSADLDSLGGCSYIFTPDDATFVLEGVNALKTIDITLLYDGTYYDVKPFYGEPLRGYVMAQQAKRGGRRAVVSGTPKLWDILRDPPGGGSSAYIEEGSKLSYGYSMDLAASAGFKVETSTGSGANVYNGFVAAPGGAGESAGDISYSSSTKGIDLSFVFNFGSSWNYTYNMDITERIQTRGSGKWVGSKGDLFIGTTDNLVFQDALAVRVIPDSMYQIVKGHEGGSYKTSNGVTVKVPVGTTKVLATGTDDTGKPVYLVRDEVMMVSPVVKSTFIHSQEYIENELLPDLIKIRNALILPMGYDPSKAKKLANERGYAAYISRVPDDSDDFGLEYDIFFPDNDTKGDSVAALNNEAVAWIAFLAKNEQEKLGVMPNDLVKRYDFDGGAASIQYSESFSTATSQSRYLRYPILTGLGNITGEYGVLAKLIAKLADKLVKKGGSITTSDEYFALNENGEPTMVEMKVFGTTWKTKWDIITSINLSDKYTGSETHSKKAGFTLAASSKSSLTVDVYRTGTEYSIDENTNTFNELTLDMLNKVRYGHLTPPMLTYAEFSGTKVYSNFVFRTIAGTTCEPYEGARVTKWYQPGTVIDVATIPIDKPRIWIDEPVVSNVPFDEPARFVLHMANETDFPNQSSLVFNYFIQSSSNPNGAKICVDGKPLGPGGENITLYPAVGSDGKHVVFTKELTVYPSKAFDYEDLTICLYDPEDAARVFSQKFSAHFIPTPGKVKVTVPSDKWVVNTESPYDGVRKAWYMPVRIEGFDVNYPNFDHVELQYKLSTQGDKDWVSVCSYYADSDLRAKASGVTDTIPSTGIIVAPFYGETDPVEQYYDLRAAVYCRHAGGYLTGYSDVLTGIKDTRLPVAFGTPEPTNGILGIGDDIKITFSEPIAGNYLRNINNFEVLGQVNSNDISTSTCLSFDGHAAAFTQATRNLTGKSFTLDVMLNPAHNNKDMAVFSHGDQMKGVSFGITADRHLMATVNGKTVVSDSIVKFTGVLQPVAWSLYQGGEDMVVTFFDGSAEIGSKKIVGKYDGVSSLNLATSNYVSDAEGAPYEGDMLEMRLWNRAMDTSELDTYKNKRLTGYETGLLNYYPMNEGSGEWAYDKGASYMDMVLVNTSWKRPAGISIALNGDKGMQLAPDKFSRTNLHDYTLMFWFRTDGLAGTLFANGEAKEGQHDQLNIGMLDGSIYVRSNGFESWENGMWFSTSWHHFAMSVSRSQNVANVYVDKKLVMSFPAEKLGGIQGDHIALGATYASKNGNPTNILRGNIDEVAMFASTLPVNLIREFSTHAPKGTMSALMAYLDFGRSEKMDDNTQHLEPTGVSLKRYVDNQGKILARRDTLVSFSEVRERADRSSYAPMTSSAQMDNVNYNFVAHDNQLLIDITEPDYMVEKTNIYVTVKEVPDLQGNLMASPITMDLFVYRNPLRWSVKSIERRIAYGEGIKFYATVKNLSGVSQYFEISDLPVWITASQTNGTIESLGEQEIEFTVSDYINVGTYTELITLTGENSMSEPLPITLRVRGEGPKWAVGDRLHQMNQTMMMVTQVMLNNEIATSTEDVLAVFDEQEQVLGVAHIEVNNRANANEALAYLTIYGYSYADGSWPKLHFRFYDASTGIIYNLAPQDEQEYTFQKDALIGTAAEPVVLRNNYEYVQMLNLKKGWNWVSLNVYPFKKTVGDFFSNMSNWEPGDIVTTINGTQVEQFTCRENKKSPTGYAWDNQNDTIEIKNSQMYNIYSMSDKTVYLEGWLSFNAIQVSKNWNRIAFLSTINLPVAQAMADYADGASVGDVLKSQEAFAVASWSNSGIVWKGSLQFLEAGKGYMLKRLKDNETEFYYPIYFDENRYSGESKSRSTRAAAVNTATTMNIVAAVEGIDTEADDRLVVFRGAERMAEAVADDEQLFYLNIGSEDKADGTFTFAIEREGEIIATTPTRIAYTPNALLGTPDAPTAISFVSLDQMPHDGLWYTIGGLKVGAKKPIQSGVYIHNGKAVVVEK